MPALLRNLLLLVLVLCIVNVGCVTPASYYAATGDAQGALSTAADHSQHAHEGYAQMGHSGGKVALWIAAGILIATVITIDLLILPWTHSDPFPCCRGVLTICH